MGNFSKGPGGQRGLTAISIVIIVGIVALLVTAALKLFSPFMDHMTVTSILTTIAEEGSGSPGEIRASFSKLLDVNSVRSLDASIISVERNGPHYEVTADYEVRTPYMGNIDFVVKFNETVQVPAR